MVRARTPPAESALVSGAHEGRAVRSLSRGARWVVVVFAALEALGYWYVHRPGGPIWISGTQVPWMLIDVAIVIAMLRGSRRALVISTWLAWATVVFVVVGELVEDQAGILAMLAIATSQFAALGLVWIVQARAQRPRGAAHHRGTARHSPRRQVAVLDHGSRSDRHR